MTVFLCFLIIKESTFETMKNVFYFLLKALFFLEIFKVQNFKILKFLDVIKWLSLIKQEFGNEIWPVFLTLQKKLLSKNSKKNKT